jgi:hypothetical protein
LVGIKKSPIIGICHICHGIFLKEIFFKKGSDFVTLVDLTGFNHDLWLRFGSKHPVPNKITLCVHARLTIYWQYYPWLSNGHEPGSQYSKMFNVIP